MTDFRTSQKRSQPPFSHLLIMAILTTVNLMFSFRFWSLLLFRRADEGWPFIPFFGLLIGLSLVLYLLYLTLKNRPASRLSAVVLLLCLMNVFMAIVSLCVFAMVGFLGANLPVPDYSLPREPR
ncbi:hypothetical protein [uncultured Rubinisphaera sp.]|uniref:hypothetical protein n=1 Tax=uncultured Rubinisphaera sp. TaxID=1678686 RepID=UPI0030DAC2D2